MRARILLHATFMGTGSEQYAGKRLRDRTDGSILDTSSWKIVSNFWSRTIAMSSSRSDRVKNLAITSVTGPHG